jgi:hypothetical protein
MAKNLNFCGGLPRSGSTVLMNILQQNPEIFTTATCALPDILHHHILVKSRYREFHQAMDAEQADTAMYGLIHGAAQGWFSGLTSKPVVISKNRSWVNLMHLFPNGKMIALVRDLRDIVDSFERLNFKIKALHSYGDESIFVPAMNVHQKYKYYFNESNAFSFSLYQALPTLMEKWKIDSSNIMFIRYEDFCCAPEYTLEKIYNFLSLNYYIHDLDNIEQSYLYEHDNAYFRERTSHKTQKQFNKILRTDRTISDELANKIVKENTWFYENFYPDVLK